MDVSTHKFSWINPPEHFKAGEGFVEFNTEPDRDFWQKTYYHFSHDNGHMYLSSSAEPFFSFTAKISFNGKARFDQAGLMIYQDENHWAKSGIEREDESYSNLGAVVTDRGYSDWSMSPIDPRRDTFYLRLNRRSEDFLFEYSDTGSSFQPIRMFHLHKASDELRFGLYACSPGKSSFTVKFSNLQMGEGTWAEHRP